MARMPVLASSMMMLGLAVTAGCQSPSPRKPNPTPIVMDNAARNKQVAGGNPYGNPDPFPQVGNPNKNPSLPMAPAKGQSVEGLPVGFNNPGSGPNLGNPGSNQVSPPLILQPGNRSSTITQPGGFPDPFNPPAPPPSTNTPAFP